MSIGRLPEEQSNEMAPAHGADVELDNETEEDNA